MPAEQIDALPGLPPKELETLSEGTGEIFDAAQAGEWNLAVGALEEMTAAWDGFRAGDMPPRLETQIDAALEELASTVDARDVEAARQAALNATLASLDLQLRYRCW